MKNRIKYIDIAKGIAILLMIAGHSLQMQSLLWKIINSFHMPLFIIASGFFFKEKPIKTELKTCLFKLYIPTAVISFAESFLRGITAGTKAVPALINSLKCIILCWSRYSKITYNSFSVSVLWFIYMLIIVRLLFLITKKIAGENDLFLLFAVICETYAGYIVGIKGYFLPWSVDIAFAMIIFYYVGYILNRFSVTDYLHEHKVTFIAIIPIWIVGLILNSIGPAMRLYPNGLWSYVTAVCGSLVVLEISRITENRTKYISLFFSWCGKNSLYILYFHLFDYHFMKYPFKVSSVRLLKALTVTSKIILCTTAAFIYTTIKKIIIKPFRNRKKAEKTV